MGTNIKQVNVQLSEVNLEKFARYYPGRNLSWALDLLLEKFVSVLDKTPEEYADIAIQHFREEIE